MAEANTDATPEDSKPTALVTGAATDLGLDVTRRLLDAGYGVVGGARDSSEASALRALGVLPVYPGLTRAGEIASVLRATEATILINLEPQRVNHTPLVAADWSGIPELISAGTPSLIEAGAQVNAAYVLHVSYAFAYGDTQGNAVTESVKTDRDDPFLAAVGAADQQVVEAGGSVLRAGFLYGAGDAALTTLYHFVRTGKSIPDGQGLANWVHTSDLARAVMLAVEGRISGEIINVVDGSPAAPSEFVQFIAQEIGLPAPGAPSGFLSRRRRNAMQDKLLALSLRVNNDKATSLLGWKPEFADYRAGLDSALLTLRASMPVT